MEEARLGQHLPADEAYQMFRGPNVITTASMDRVNEYHGPHRKIETTRARVRREAMERHQRATDPEVMDEQRVNMSRRQSPLTAYIPTSPVSLSSDSSKGIEIVEGPKPEVIDMSIDEIEAIFMNDVTDQIAEAEAQAKADAEAEDEARRSGKPVKRKKTDDTNRSTARKDPPGPNPDKGKRLP
jgi:Zn-finger nucleic acid-binding protein